MIFLLCIHNKKKMKLTKAQQKALLAQHSAKLAGNGLNPAGMGLNPAGDGLKLAGRGKKLVKGSLEAKARMSVLRAMRKKSKKKNNFNTYSINVKTYKKKRTQ